MRYFVFGCGYLGLRVARQWLTAGQAVGALTRSHGRAEKLRDMGLLPTIGDVTDLTTLSTLPIAEQIVYAVGYDRQSSASRREVVVQGIENVLHALPDGCQRLLFVSTTGVYGQTAGEWVDETSVTTPDSESGRLAVEAEHRCQELCRARGLELIVLRMSGLYGPGRLLRRVEQLQAGEAISGDGSAWLNLVHVNDAALAVRTAAARPISRGQQQVWLMSDDLPVSRQTYYGELARQTNAPPPVFDALADSRIHGLGKRCRNAAIKAELNLHLQFPSYREGLVASLQETTDPDI